MMHRTLKAPCQMKRDTKDSCLGGTTLMKSKEIIAASRLLLNPDWDVFNSIKSNTSDTTLLKKVREG